ncbi:hypothetical protein KSP40_PGU014225 [Platanthera guangdongensis]|uniref:Retroviral polymerase SH3-like domain-containing protein n=1 Tax=Platanthera guangdongensis TaxID=2320717 RepID=A0ABR2LCV0_9ASPA
MEIFLGYSQVSKAYRVYNKSTMKMEETVHISFDETVENCEVKVGEWRTWATYPHSLRGHVGRLPWGREDADGLFCSGLGGLFERTMRTTVAVF